MKKSRFTDSQIMEALKRVEAGLAVPELCPELGISTATFYKWRSKYGGIDVSLMPILRHTSATGVSSSACFNANVICSPSRH